MRTIFVTGGGGFVGSNFLARPPSGYRIVAPRHEEVDILDKKQLLSVFESTRPDVVVNFAAFRNASKAERERGDKRGIVWKTNVTGVRYLAEMTKKYKSFLIHISTDMVFGGTPNHRGPFDERQTGDTSRQTLSWYGWTKAEAERALFGMRHVAVIRIGNVTQPIYDPTRDYVGKIAYLLDRDELYPLFSDQYLTLTAIPSLLSVLEALIYQEKSGTFHVASTNVFTPYVLGQYLAAAMGKSTNSVRKARITEYLHRNPQRYPQYGGLLSQFTAGQLGVRFGTWQSIVDRYVAYASHLRTSE